MIITNDQADNIMKVFYEFCDKHQHCPACEFYDRIEKHCSLNAGHLQSLLWKCCAATNEEKFKEIFGFPIYELHQLSEKEEGEWLEKIYQKMD